MSTHRFSLYENTRVSESDTPPVECADALRPEECATARAEIRSWPDYRSTPLRTLAGMARAAGIESLLYKDESDRFGLGSFKALGGAYAVRRFLSRALADRDIAASVSTADLEAGKHADVVSELTVCCATDGNHGRAVAWGAQMFGCACVIYIHAHVSEAREAAIASYGARVVRIDGNYDDSLERAAEDARAHDWHVISDTSYPGYTDVPREVMAGYAVMVDETLRALPDERPPTHVFVQGGVGGLAAAVCASLWWMYGAARPRLVVVEPENAACLYASARAGKHVHIDGDLDTVMAGLSCGEPSLIAWPLLLAGAHDFMCLEDDAALVTMRRLAAGEDGDTPVVGGESGVAGLAGLLTVCANREAAARRALGADSRVLVFGTEGDTDAELYTRIVGESGAQVRARQWSSPRSNSPISDTDEQDKQERKAQAFLADAYALETQADTLAFYDRWADEYDAQVDRGLHYLAPRTLAETLARYHAAGDAPILDIGCGTGLTGCCLQELGFSTIDGLDLSKAMLEKAEEKCVYRDLVEADLNKTLPFADGAYAAAISTGTFTLGHVGPEPVDELLRVLEPGGIFACTVHLAIWESRGFSRKFAELEHAGALRVIEQDTGYYFEGSEPTARYCVFRKAS